jgi:hypothetical protein
MFSFSVGVPSTSAIPDYPTLKTTVADWLDRDDLDPKVPVFIQMCEAMFNRELRTPDMESQANIVFTSGSADLPSDYLAMRSIYIAGSPERPLRGMAPTAVHEEFDGTSGIPAAYVLMNGGISLVPPPDSTTTAVLLYFSRIEALSDANESNWLLEKHPDLYLYGTLYNAEIYLDNAARAGLWKELLEQTLGRVNQAAQNDRFGAGPLVPNAVAQVGYSRC